MTQNKSTAVMQRRTEPRDSLDDFPTPPWATRALCEWLLAQYGPLSGHSVREPACNRGFMTRPLTEYFGSVLASDVYDYGFGYPVVDFLAEPAAPADFLVTNPPFRLAQAFIEKALRETKLGVAVIVRSAFLEGVGRYTHLFQHTPPSHVLQFTERVPMVKGRYDASASTATAYCWLIWLHAERDEPTRLEWIAPCKTRLFRESDTEDVFA